MATVRLTQKELIEPFLRRNPYLNLYALGDLDETYWPQTTWYAFEAAGRIEAILLLYSGFEIPTLMALGDEPREALFNLLESIRHILPDRLYAHLSPGCTEILQLSYRVESRGPHWKMALLNPSLQVPGVDRVERLTHTDVGELKNLYAVGYPINWFDPRQIASGYYGLRDQGSLVSAAGTHVNSACQRVAGLGNIVTHPEHRGKGFAAAVIARLCTDLLPNTDHIGLNVKADNAAAIACYHRLGFKPVAEYEEVMLTRSDSP